MNSLLKNYVLTLSPLIYGFGICYVCSCRSDYNKNGTRCYKYYKHASWEEAYSTCTHDNASLIKIDDVNAFKLSLVQSILAETKIEIWVGARRKPGTTIIQWFDGDNVSRFWYTGEPNDAREECVEAKYYSHPSSLNHLQCEHKLPFVCDGQCRSDYTRNGTICSKYFANAVSWEDADRRCKGDNSTLFKIDTRDTLSLLQSIMTNNAVPSIWVGARRNSYSSEFQWINGANVSQFWGDGEPNNNGGNENCVILALGTPGFLNDQSCKISIPFVCEAQDASEQLTTPGVTSQRTPRDKSNFVTETSAQLTTQGVINKGAPEDKSDTTLLAVKIAVPSFVVGLLSGALTAVACIYLKRRKRQTPAYDDTATAANPSAYVQNYSYLSTIDNELHHYDTVK
ncbi:C-type mannose receptor 2-like isoform X2 [Dreissena polymorpha]|uniref:C-type mannose receptor 2-like isoform X2 n=1 Tax=Dreissena polymorpha TaxID=45954 RepID=UPI0022640D86|nr:C-type mannose receptor 2-like isoform X2 [Dreissena polymorpha]